MCSYSNVYHSNGWFYRVHICSSNLYLAAKPKQEPAKPLCDGLGSCHWDVALPAFFPQRAASLLHLAERCGPT